MTHREDANRTGASSRTVMCDERGFVTIEAVPVCEDCASEMVPLVFVCPTCGSVGEAV